ncbi:polysaccharide deacetylase family protein [Paenibacillus sp. 19GGS1-52]|uniref:polysaccharide deacetylase family protein n=1 Tax=Paenibacillus sp. 19GGS1-52 TaxID=2758563 RepID=UPI001EFA6114|nr:polysaccharide deacetylase family protein [Paenibacillus sp. 19GGS1-52]ULO10055.1 polysaccharide deacetylase family protein [Paenibacillus sp. 19GGS1-52]
MDNRHRGWKQIIIWSAIIALLCPFSASGLASADLQESEVTLDSKVTQSSTVPEEQAVSAGTSSAASATQSRKNSKGLSLSQLLRKYPETIMTKGPRSKIIALTFDDVPDPRFTPQVLDVLKKYHVKATFFVVGSRAKKHPELVARMIREGHVVGNHSYNHPQFVKLTLIDFRSEIIRTENVLQALAGYKPRLIRPPYGDISEQQLRWAKARGYKLVNWNVDSLDWRGLSKAQVRNNILSHAGKGSIILQHGGGGRGSNLRGTIQALPEVITIMRKRGYTFVTVPQMLQVSKNK